MSSYIWCLYFDFYVPRILYPFCCFLFYDGCTTLCFPFFFFFFAFSVQFSCSVMSDSLRPHESQHARPPCPSPTHGVHSDSSPSSQWCHPAISFSVVPFFSCPQSLAASGSFPMSQLFTWGGLSSGVSASASFLPKKSQGKVREESEKVGLKLSENEDHGIWSHHFMANRWGNSGNSVRLYFGGLQNHCRWWLQPWN